MQVNRQEDKSDVPVYNLCIIMFCRGRGGWGGDAISRQCVLAPGETPIETVSTAQSHVLSHVTEISSDQSHCFLHDTKISTANHAHCHMSRKYYLTYHIACYMSQRYLIIYPITQLVIGH